MTEPTNPAAPQGAADEGLAAEMTAAGPGGDDADRAEAAPEAAAEPADIDEQVAELTADLQRVSAEFANYRKRTVATVAEARESGKALVLGKLLDLLDDLERARDHGDLEAGPLKALSDKLAAVLSGEGLQAFGTDGDEFDPAVHEAVQHAGTGSDLVVGGVLRRGYRVGERVLRHAMVAVADRPVTDDESTNRGE